MTKRTISAKVLKAEADQIERDANQSLAAWIILGEGEKFSAAMAEARKLRRAAEIKSIATRREFLAA